MTLHLLSAVGQIRSAGFITRHATLRFASSSVERRWPRTPWALRPRTLSISAIFFDGLLRNAVI